MTGRTPRLTLYDIGAVCRSLVGVLAVMAVAAAFGLSAAVITGAAAVIAGAAALQDSPRGRFPIVVMVAVEMAVAVLLGAISADHDVAVVVVATMWCVLAGLHWALSANAGLVAAAGTALMLITATTSHTVASALAVTGFALIGGLSQAVLIAVWPQRRWRTQRSALTRAYLSLAATADRMAVDTGVQIDREPLIQLREAFTLTEAQAKRRPPIHRGWYGLPERIAESLTALRGRAADDEAVGRSLHCASELLVMIAHARRSNRSEVGYAAGQMDGATAGVDAATRPIVGRLSDQLREAVELRFGQFEPEQVAQLRHRGLPDALPSVAGLIRSQLTRSSPILRHTVRLTVATAVGVGLWRFGGLGHGVWIALTVLMVLRPETAHTYTRCVGRIIATALGVAVIAAALTVVHPTVVVSALLAVVLLAIAYVSAEFNYLAVNTALAGAIVFLLYTGAPAEANMIGDRLLATVIGGALAITAHVLLPDNSLVRLQQRAGELLKTEIDYAATVIKAFVHDLDHPKEALESAWERAVSARTAFEAAAGATTTESHQVRRWMRSYRAALNAVTSSCATLEAHLPGRPPAALNREFIAAVDDYVNALCGEPATPAAPWSVDTDALLAAGTGVQDASTLLTDADAAERVLVGEIATITEVVADIATSDIERAR